MPRRTPTRRDVLSTFALSAAALPLLGSAACAGPRRVTTAGRVRHAGIGVGGMGAHDLGQIAAHADVDVVALCDVDARNLAAAAEKHPDARVYTDWRALLREEAGRIDSVHVTVPDHMHAPIMVTALRMGLHVYGQKPLTRTVQESRVVAAEAARAGVATSMGIQNRSDNPYYRKALQWFRQGHIGKVHEVHVWTDRPKGWWPQGEERKPGTDPVPETLDWDKWLGGAPERPYLDGRYHPFAWRGALDFGTGAQGDMGCHLMDPALWFLGLDRPFSIRSWGPRPTSDTYPLWSRVRMEFEPTLHCTRGPTIVWWHDGGRKVPAEVLESLGVTEVTANACLFLGTHGALLADPYADPQLLPHADFAAVPLPEVPAINHWHDWVDTCLGRQAESMAPFSYAAVLSEAALLGNVALHFPHETLVYDAKGMSFEGQPEADDLLRSRYRAGWEVDGLG